MLCEIINACGYDYDVQQEQKIQLHMVSFPEAQNYGKKNYLRSTSLELLNIGG